MRAHRPLSAAGQAELDQLRPLAYPDTDIFLACFALNNRQSLASVREKWFDEARREVLDVPVLLVGTKLDLRQNADPSQVGSPDKEFISTEEGSALASELGAVGFKECSALTQDGLKEVFDTAFSHVLEARRAPPRRRRRCAIL